MGVSGRGNRRARRAGVAVSLVGLVMTLFLAVGQVGLIAASADGWSDRSAGGAGDSATVSKGADVASRDTKPAGDAKGSVAAPQVLALTPIVPNMIDAYEGIVAGTSNWTSGNLCQGNGICYKELDNVPHRVKLKTLTPGTEYSITILLDAFDGAGHPGYDNLNGATGFSGVSGGVSVVQNANTTCGQSTECLSYTLTFTASAADAEIRFNAHLAIGAHLFGGSSLSARIDGSAKNVPLPVGDILLDIRAHKFNDLNGNGTQEQGEPDLAGWQMTLYSGPECSGQPIDVTGNSGTDPNPGTTGANGNVMWTNLSASDGDNDGAFSVKETLQAGWENTTPLCQEVTVVGLENLAIFGNQQKLPNLTIDKTGPATVAYGDPVTYEITVENTGNGSTADDVIITDSVPAELSNVAATYSFNGGADQACSVVGNDVTCNVGVMDAGDSVVVTITADAPSDSCPTFVNQAFVAVGTDEPIASNEVETTVTGCAPELSIVKEAVDEAGAPVTEVSPGDSFSYVITVENEGNADATGVVVTDDLDDTLTIDAASYEIGAASGSCDVDNSDNTIRCPQAPDTETLQPGESMVVTIDVTTDPAVCGTLMNTANVAWGETDLDSNLVEVDVTGCAPNLTIDKTGPATVPFGGELTYEITVENTGNAATADDVIITDTVPAELENVAATYSFNGGADQACSVVGNDVTCNVGVMDPGDSVVVTITADAPSDECPTFVNRAYVGVGTDEPTASNEVETTVTGCAAELILHKTGPATAEVGGLITYSVTVENTGNAATADSVVVTDEVDSDLSGVTASFSLNGGADQDCDVTGNSVSCDLGVLQSGASAVITISGTAPTDVCPEIVNQAFIGDLGSEIITTTIDCPPPGIDLVKDGDNMAHVGDTVTYTFDVTLTPDSLPLSNVVLTDPICDAAPTSPTGDDGDQILEQGETWGYTCTHVVTESDPDPLPNTAHVSGWFGEQEVTDEDSHEVDILHPAIQVVKRARPDSGSPGEEITYHYTITNTGDATLYDISVDDDVIGHVCDIAVLQPNESKECTKKYTLPDDGTIKVTNVVVAEGTDALDETVKDDDTETVDVILGQTITKTPPGPIAFTGTSSVIPLGALLLVFVTAGSALLWLGRRRGRQASTE